MIRNGSSTGTCRRTGGWCCLVSSSKTNVRGKVTPDQCRAVSAGLHEVEGTHQATPLGGVLLMTWEQVLRVNGYSPLLWDSGHEDDNMQERLQHKHMWPPEQPQVGNRQGQGGSCIQS